jgi:hypothetical protein
MAFGLLMAQGFLFVGELDWRGDWLGDWLGEAIGLAIGLASLIGLAIGLASLIYEANLIGEASSLRIFWLKT